MGPEPGGGKPAEWPSDYDAGVCVNQNLVDVTLLSGLHTLTLWPIKGTLGEGTHSLYGNEACSVTSKHAVGSCCTAWRIITSVNQKMMSKGNIANVYSAKLAEQAERYDEMAQHMRNVGSAGSSLSV